jgi:hypothetical protein
VAGLTERQAELASVHKAKALADRAASIEAELTGATQALIGLPATGVADPQTEGAWRSAGMGERGPDFIDALRRRDAARLRDQAHAGRCGAAVRVRDRVLPTGTGTPSRLSQSGKTPAT